MQPFHQDETFAVLPHQDRALQADLEDALGDLLRLLGIERRAPFHRHVDVGDRERRALHHGWQLGVRLLTAADPSPCTCSGRLLRTSTPPHPLALLRARRERPRHGGAEEHDERAPLHSITSSARASSVGGTSRPSVLAVFRLITSSYLVGSCTGRSAGSSPRRMRSTYDAARRYWSTLSGP